jgi:cell division protein FtsQ
MFFKRKPRNRRLGREYVLDVKLRSSQVRAARMRLVSLSAATLFGTVFALYLVWRIGEWTLNRLVYENKAFAIQLIDLQTDGVLAIDELRRWSGVKPGENLLALDLGRVKRDLELVPMVQSVSVERILPRTVRIRVTEREPIAQVNVPRPHPGGTIELVPYQLDTEGYVIPPLDPHARASSNQAPEELPVVSGVDPNKLQAGRPVDGPQVLAALELILAFEHSPMAGLVDLKRIDVTVPEVLVVTTDQGSEITFGVRDIDRQMRRWREIQDKGQKMGKALSFLDLAVSNNIPARWLEASALPPPTPKLTKPLRNKKKHV